MSMSVPAPSAAAPAKKRKVGCLVGGVLGLALLGGISSCLGGGASQNAAAPAPAAVSSQTQPASVAPSSVAPAVKPKTVKEAVAARFGEQVRAGDVFDDGKYWHVTFKIKDNLGNSLIRAGAQKDTLDALRIVHEMSPKRGAIIEGTFPMQDAKGNNSEPAILSVTYPAETMAEINWAHDGIPAGRVWDAAEPSPKFIHPDLQG